MTLRKKSKPSDEDADPFVLLTGKKLDKTKVAHVHIFGHGFKCATESRGYATPDNKGPLELVLDATEGYIPLWTKAQLSVGAFKRHRYRFLQIRMQPRLLSDDC